MASQNYSCIFCSSNFNAPVVGQEIDRQGYSVLLDALCPSCGGIVGQIDRLEGGHFHQGREDCFISSDEGCTEFSSSSPRFKYEAWGGDEDLAKHCGKTEENGWEKLGEPVGVSYGRPEYIWIRLIPLREGESPNMILSPPRPQPWNKISGDLILREDGCWVCPLSGAVGEVDPEGVVVEVD